MGQLIVSKFGGSSVKDASAMKRCGKIVAANPLRKLIVISATFNTTNQLEEMYKSAKLDLQNALMLLNKNKERHEHLLKDLMIDFVQSETMHALELLNDIFDEAKSLLIEINEGVKSERLRRGNLESAQQEILAQLYSIGERTSSLIFYQYLKNILPENHLRLVDARTVIRTDSNFLSAAPKFELMRAKIEGLLPNLNNSNEIIVTQGFIGMDDQGRTTVLGREGSDYTATLFGYALKPAAVEIWTDVSGIFSIDPRIMPSTHAIKEMDYGDATLMASLGAKVLFDQTLAPISDLKIPVYVASSMAPDSGGTWIRDIYSANLKEHPPVGIAVATGARTLKQLESRFNQKNPGILLSEKYGVVSVIGKLPASFSLEEFFGSLGVSFKILEQDDRHISLLLPIDRAEECAVALHSRLF